MTKRQEFIQDEWVKYLEDIRENVALEMTSYNNIHKEQFTRDDINYLKIYTDCGIEVFIKYYKYLNDENEWIYKILSNKSWE